LVLAGVLLVQQATAGIVATKRTASIREAVGMHHFMQGQLQNPERLGTATYEQLSRLVELAGAQAAQYLVIVEGPASVLSSSSGIGLDSVPPELRQQVTGRDGMYIAATQVVISREEAGQPGVVVGTTLITSAGERFPVYYVFPMTSEVTTLRDIQRAVYTTGAALLLGLTAASSTEMEPETPDPVVTTMDSQRQFVAGGGDLGGTMRLGAYPATLVPGSIVADAYGATDVSERHRHRFEVNNAYRERLAAVGLHVTGTSPDGHLTEFVELDRDLHPYFVATQAHPELKSRPTRAHPLFVGLIRAALKNRRDVYASHRLEKSESAGADENDENEERANR